MGQGPSCSRSSDEHDFFSAVQRGDLAAVESAVADDPSLLRRTTILDRLSALHVAVANGHLEILSMLLDRGLPPDLLSRNKQTPLMVAAMHGKIECLIKLLQSGANILMFDSLHGRTCLHYAAYHGHRDCLEAILAAAESTAVAASWGFSRFVNIRDGKGATPLHLAARQRRPSCVHMLLDRGALVSASTGASGFPGSTPLHWAARSGCLDSVRELLAWGADRLQRDASGRIPYAVALKWNHGSCAALMNPSSPEPLVWPSPLKFISDLKTDAKVLLEAALMNANMEREKKIFKGMTYSLASPTHFEETIDDTDSEEEDVELCCICFEKACTIEVQDCGHQMCAFCTLALCCHNKPSPLTLLPPTPVCPFCRSNIAQLVVAKSKTEDPKADDADKDITMKLRRSRKSRHPSEGSSSFKSLSAAMGSFGKMASRSSSGKKPDTSGTADKP